MRCVRNAKLDAVASSPDADERFFTIGQTDAAGRVTDARLDALSAILDDLRLHAYVTGLTHFHAPWSLRFPGPAERAGSARKLPKPVSPRGDAKPPGGGFHLVVSGACRLAVDGESALTLEAGDLAVIVNRPGLTLCDSDQTPARLVFDVLPPPPPAGEPRREVHVGTGGGAVTSLLGGGFFFDSPQADRLLPALPPLLLVRSQEMDHPWSAQMTPLLIGELRDMSRGAQAVVNNLASVLFIKAVRHYVSRLSLSGGNSGVTALLDAEIGKAVLAIHRDPGAPWSVARLADHVLMSRSAFAARFAQRVGVPPMTYLSEFRMNRARTLLSGGGVTVKDVARRVGYDSEAAFSHAYKRRFGQTPRSTRGPLRVTA